MGISTRFIDGDGFAWQVCEVPRADQIASTREEQQGWLYFFSREITRVLSPYPDNWRELSWRELDVLCKGAKAPGSRGRPLGRAPNVPRTADARS